MRINEIFHSWQGEGLNSGIYACFIRLSGCNLSCDWCDTQHEKFVEMTERQIVDCVDSDNVIITGGEPLAQNLPPLIQALQGKHICLETNGTFLIPDGLNFVSCSPKSRDFKIENLQKISELKLVIDENTEPSFIFYWRKIFDGVIWLQPEGNKPENLKLCEDYSKKFDCRVGHQLHKIRTWK